MYLYGRMLRLVFVTAFHNEIIVSFIKFKAIFLVFNLIQE